MPHSPASHAARAEYDAVMRPGGTGLLDRSVRAVLRLTGADRHSFLQGMVSNDVAALAPGQGCHAAFLDTTGHLLAELNIHALPDALFVETDPRCIARLSETLDKYLIMEDVEITNVSSDWAILSLLGEGARKALAAVLGAPVPELPPRANAPVLLPDGAAGFVVSLSHGPKPGLELWLPPASVPAVHDRLMADGAVSVGTEAAEILRVEAGLPAWGKELDESVLLPEAEMPDAVSYTKGCYVGQEIIARLRARGHTNRALRGFLLGPDAPLPHPGDTLHVPEDGSDAGREVGRITSAVASPQFQGRALCLAYVRKEYCDNGATLNVQIPQPDGTVFSFTGRVLTRPFQEPAIPAGLSPPRHE